MKKFGILFTLLLVVACAQEKTAYVDHVRLMDNTKEKADIENKYKAKSTALNKKRDSISQAFQIEAQALQTKVENMSQVSSSWPEFDFEKRKANSNASNDGVFCRISQRNWRAFSISLCWA